MMFESKEDVKYQKVQQNRLNATLDKIEFNKNHQEQLLARQQKQVRSDLRAMTTKTARSPSLTRRERKLGLLPKETPGQGAGQGANKPQKRYVTSRNIIVKGRVQKRIPLLQEDQNRLAEANHASIEKLREKFKRDHENEKRSPKILTPKISTSNNIYTTNSPNTSKSTSGPPSLTTNPPSLTTKPLKLPHIESATPKPKLSKQLSREEEYFTFPQHRLKKQSSIHSTQLHEELVSMKTPKDRTDSVSSDIFASSQTSDGKRNSMKDLLQLDDVLLEKRKQLEEERQTWKDVKQCRYLRGYEPPNMVLPENTQAFVFGEEENLFPKEAPKLPAPSSSTSIDTSSAK